MDVGIINSTANFATEVHEKGAEDPIHFPLGIVLIPLAGLSFFLWVTPIAFQAIVLGGTHPYALFAFAVLLVLDLVVLTLIVVFSVLGVRVYEWRMSFRQAHLPLYRVAQVWRILVSIFTLSAVWNALDSGMSDIPATSIGTVPIWVFVPIMLSLGALVSISVSTFSHVLLSVARILTSRSGRRDTGSTE